MTQPNCDSSFSLKVFLFLAAIGFAVAAVILIFSATSAATITGSAPALAISLIDGPNTGLIAPGGQRWFKLTPSAGQAGHTVNVENSLTLFFTPGDGPHTQRVQLQIFNQGQLPLFFGDASHMANLGAGQIISRDNNPETGELFWTGWLFSQQSYYVQLSNGNDTPIDYWLFTDNVISYPLSEPSTLPPVISNHAPAPTPNVRSEGLAPLNSGVTQARLGPNSTHWYTFSPFDPSSPNHFIDKSFSMFFTPDDGQRSQRVNFKLFPARAVEMWQHGESNQLVNFGSGELVSRDGDPNTGERIWCGVVLQGETYLLAIENSSEVEIDYKLFEGDIIHPPPGP